MSTDRSSNQQLAEQIVSAVVHLLDARGSGHRVVKCFACDRAHEIAHQVADVLRAMKPDETTDEIQGILRDIASMDCFYTGSSHEPDCECIVGRAERALYPQVRFPEETTDELKCPKCGAADSTECPCSPDEQWGTKKATEHQQIEEFNAMLKQPRAGKPDKVGKKIGMHPQCHQPNDCQEDANGYCAGCHAAGYR